MADTFPTLTIEAGFGSNWQTTEASISWTDISAYVIAKSGVKMYRGRSSQFDRFAPGTASFTLRNTDRRFDPSNTAGPYFGNLVPGTPVRMRATYNAGAGAVTYPRWRGFVDDWPLDISSATYAETRINCTDGLGMLARTTLPSSWYELTVLNDEPVAFWRMGALADGDTMVDSANNGADGTIVNATFGLDSLVYDTSDRAIFIGHSEDARGIFYDAGLRLPTQGPLTIEFVVQVERNVAEMKTLFKINKDQANASGLSAYITFDGDAPNGEIIVNFSGLGGGWRRRGSTRVDDGLPHHVLLSITNTTTMSMYVDGVLQTWTTISGSSGGTWPDHLYWVVGNVIDTTGGDFGLGGVIDEFAVYDSALDATAAAEHARVAREGGSTVPTDRITAILDWVSWPAAQRDISTPDVQFGVRDYGLDGNALAATQRIDQSMQSRQYIAADGKFTQRPRYWYLNSGTVSTVTFSDDNGVGAVAYDSIVFGAPRQYIKNVVSGSRADGPKIEVRDAASVTAYGEAAYSMDGMFAASDSAVRSTLEYILARYKDPSVRVTQVVVPLLDNIATTAPKLLGLELDDRVTVESTPASTGSQIVFEVAVDGIEDTVTDLDWKVTLSLSPTDVDTDFGLWGTGLWGTALWA